MNVVFDASTLILLAKIQLLREISQDVRIIIPESVKEESLCKKSYDSLLIETLMNEQKIQVMKVKNTEAVKKIHQNFRLGIGEAQAFCLAGELGCPLAVDDGPTIKACKIIGLEFATAIHFLLKLCFLKKIDKDIAMEKLHKLARFGRYDRKIIEDAVNRLKGGKP